jgi:hypothetical protein
MLCSRCGRAPANKASGLCTEDERIHEAVRKREAADKRARS